MLTGTPLDLTPFGALLTGIGWFYWLLTAAGLWWALRGARPWKAKLLRALPVALVFGFLPGLGGWNAYKARSRLNESMALFQERCKAAGEKVSRIVENVDGIVWMKWREPYSNADNFADQFKLNDPYGRDCGVEDCILRLLRATKGRELDPKRELPYHSAYQFVETRDPRDGLIYRYTLRLDRPFDHDRKWLETLIKPELDREVISQTTARYAISWDDLSTRKDREHWIAGSSLKVIDQQSNEVIAERVGYMIDRGQGSQAGFRSPWLFAVEMACPEFPHEPNQSRHGRTLYETPKFIATALHPATGE